MGRAGVVLGIEMPRLARTGRDHPPPKADNHIKKIIGRLRAGKPHVQN
jgi:hypothetical protein